MNTLRIILLSLIICPLSFSTARAQKLTIVKDKVDIGQTGYEIPVTATFELRNKSMRLPKQTNNYREEVHHEKNSSFTIEQSQMSTFMMREAGVEKEENQEEYDEDIEVKPQLFDSLTRQQQKDFKELKTAFLKRDIILRDSLGAIEKFNINYDPLYSPQFQKIIEKLKSNFLLKEIFYCFQNEKWRDELYNYSPNNVLFGLSKYLKLEKIKNVIAIEKSKCLDQIKKEKSELTCKRSFERRINETNALKKINIENNIYPNNTSNMLLNNSSYSLSAVNNRYKAENLNYLEFKKRFLEALKENEKNKKRQEICLSRLPTELLKAISLREILHSTVS